MTRRIGVVLLTLVLLVVVGTIQPPKSAEAQYIGPGGALAIKPGPKEVKGNGYAVDGDTINAFIEDPQLDLREPSWNLRQKDLRELPQPPRLGTDPLGLGSSILGFLNFSNLLSPSLVLAQSGPTPGPYNPPANFAVDNVITSGLVQP